MLSSLLPWLWMHIVSLLQWTAIDKQQAKSSNSCKLSELNFTQLYSNNFSSGTLNSVSGPWTDDHSRSTLRACDAELQKQSYFLENSLDIKMENSLTKVLLLLVLFQPWVHSKEVEISFKKDAFIAVAARQLSRNTNWRLEIRFRTVHPNGILYYSEGKLNDYVAVLLHSCFLR